MRRARSATKAGTGSTGTPSFITRSTDGPAGAAAETPTPTRRDRRKPITPAEVNKVATMVSQGIRPRQVATALQTSADRVTRILAMPETQQQLLEFSDALKRRTLGHIHDANDPAWEFAKEAIQARDSKTYDNLMRGLAAQERIRASVTGDANKRDVEAVIHNDGESSAEVKMLIGILVGDARGQG